jgi:hypothetical protein
MNFEHTYHVEDTREKTLIFSLKFALIDFEADDFKLKILKLLGLKFERLMPN